MSQAADALTLQFLEWAAAAPRGHADVMETWRSSCPRLTIWEDALADGLVLYRNGRDATVTLTAKGRARLDAASPPGRMAAD